MALYLPGYYGGWAMPSFLAPRTRLDSVNV